MRFIATYTLVKKTLGAEPSYCRTIDADDLRHASRVAERYTRKGYQLLKCVQDYGKE